MKMLEEVITESDFSWYDFGTFAQNYLKQAQNEKILNQFNNLSYLRTSFDLKVQDIFETSNQREYLKIFIRG